MRTVRTLLCVLVCMTGAHAARILAVFPFFSRSHFNVYEEMMKGLARRGHQVTVVGPFPLKTPFPNYEDLSVADALPVFTNNVSAESALSWHHFTFTVDFMWREAGVNLCEATYQHPVMKKLAGPESLGKYDLFFSEIWGTDCFVGLAHKLGIPHIAIVAHMEMPWCLPRYGSPLNPSYQTNYLTDLSFNGMTFTERLYNTLLTVYLTLGQRWASQNPSDAVMRKYLGPDLPPLEDIIYNSSLLFINGHVSMHRARPLPPNIIDIAGLHLPEPAPLPEDIQKFLDGAESGAIVFTFGSMIKAESFDKEKISSFVEAFRKLPQRVLWKFDGVIPDQPKNLKVVKWMPQGDALRHPRVKLFITHGGLMGTMEAFASGVPLLGVPFFADQRSNIKNYMELGMAEELHMGDVTEQAVLLKVRTVLGDPRYGERAKRLAELFNDRPMSPMDTVIYWTEYVLRHNGAHHLRPSATQLHWYQYYLLDVLATLAAAASAVLFLLYKAVSMTLSLVFRPKQKLKTK